jgi:hypothetical protein
MCEHGTTVNVLVNVSRKASLILAVSRDQAPPLLRPSSRRKSTCTTAPLTQGDLTCQRKP